MTESDNIKQKHLLDNKKATLELLQTWTVEHGCGSEQKETLRTILVSAGLGGLVPFLEPSPGPSTSVRPKQQPAQQGPEGGCPVVPSPSVKQKQSFLQGKLSMNLISAHYYIM